MPRDRFRLAGVGQSMAARHIRRIAGDHIESCRREILFGAAVASGLLGDTLSYIRLFAIGLTGSILGGVFNTLAVTMTDGMNIVARAICMLLILLVGHSINIALCTISSLVHPLRLIFVEYYKNAEFEGGGKAYEPFRKA